MQGGGHWFRSQVCEEESRMGQFTRACENRHRKAYGVEGGSWNGFLLMASIFSMKYMIRTSAESRVGGDVEDLRIEEKVPNSHLGSRLMNLLVRFSCQVVLSAHWRLLVINLKWVLVGWLCDFFFPPSTIQLLRYRGAVTVCWVMQDNWVLEIWCTALCLQLTLPYCTLTFIRRVDLRLNIFRQCFKIRDIALNSEM